VEQWHGTLLKAGLAPRTVGHAHRLLSRVLGYAVENGTISRNVAAIRKPPKVEERELGILTGGQIAEIRAKLAGHRLLPIVEIALATCLRRGELLALRWADVDLDAGTLRVERSVEETRAGLRVKPPKTKRGRRNLTLPPDAIVTLREHRKRQIELRLALGQGGQPTLVFSSIEGDMLSPDNLSRDWCRVRTAKKLPPVPFHALRHTHASLLIRAGVDILTISRRLGHSKASVTLDTYGHLIGRADEAAAAAIEGVLK
jgi:integrase